MGSLCQNLTMAAIATLSVTGIARAALISEDWSGYQSGDLPVSPWTVAQVSGANESVTVDGNRLHYNDDGFNDTSLGYNESNKQNWNPEVGYVFASSTTQALNIRFSYSIPNDKSGAQLQFALRDSNKKTVLAIGLGKNWATTGLYYVNSSGTSVPFGAHQFALNETVTITLSNINLVTKSYDIAWSTDKVGAVATSGSTTGTFRDATAINFSSIFLSNNAAGNAKAEMYLGPVLIETVPEPASLSLVALAGLGLLWRRSRR